MRLDDLHWLAGTWSLSHGGAVWEEHWSPPLGDVMTGTTRWIQEGKVRMLELSAIRLEEDTPVLYIRHFDGGLADRDVGGPLSWPLASLVRRTAIFEDPEREFPRRVIYDRPEVDLLAARLEGTKDGEPHVTEFLFHRVD